MKIIEPIDKSFWEDKHNRTDTNWLTGSDINRLLGFYNLSPDDLKGKTVMEIGVGTGNSIKEITKLAEKTYGVDISETALEKIKDVVDGTYQTSKLKDAPECDIIICHLVFLHCSDQEVARIINDTPLAENGKFYFQASGLKDNIVTDKVRETLIDNGSHFFRNIKEMQKIISTTNKELTHITKPVYGGDYHGNWLQHEWYFGIMENKKE
jgi:SAM-dependent methyltransferase